MQESKSSSLPPRNTMLIDKDGTCFQMWLFLGEDLGMPFVFLLFPEGIMILIKTYHIPPGLEHVQSPSPRSHLCFQQLSWMFVSWLVTLGPEGNCSLHSSCPSFPIPSPPLQRTEEKKTDHCNTQNIKTRALLQVNCTKEMKQHKEEDP